MASVARIEVHETAPINDASMWARVRASVEVRPDGSWKLTPRGLAAALAIVRQTKKLDVNPST